MNNDPKKKRSYHDGANDERTVWLAKIRRLVVRWEAKQRHQVPGAAALLMVLHDLEDWGLQCNERAQKVPGGR